MEHETWAIISGFDTYQISNLGRIRSTKFNREKYLNPVVNSSGYRSIKLYFGSGYSSKKMSRLVAEAFIPNPLNLPLVDHINGNRLDDEVSNLRWVSFVENALNMKITNRNKSGKKGVHQHTGGMWVATMRINGEVKHWYFNTKDEAVSCRIEMELKYYSAEHYTEDRV